MSRHQSFKEVALHHQLRLTTSRATVTSHRTAKLSMPKVISGIRRRSRRAKCQWRRFKWPITSPSILGSFSVSRASSKEIIRLGFETCHKMLRSNPCRTSLRSLESATRLRRERDTLGLVFLPTKGQAGISPKARTRLVKGLNEAR